MAHSVCKAGNHRVQRSLAPLGSAGLGLGVGGCWPWKSGYVLPKGLTCFLKQFTAAPSCQTTCINRGAEPFHACCLHGSLSSAPDWARLGARNLQTLRFPFCCDWPSTFVFSNPASSPQTLFSHLVKAVEYKTISVQSSAAARSWKANLNLKSQISKQWCLEIFVIEFYVVAFSFCCTCKVGNYQLIIIDVMLWIWFNN